jgi:hypothetical protein
MSHGNIMQGYSQHSKAGTCGRDWCWKRRRYVCWVLDDFGSWGGKLQTSPTFGWSFAVIGGRGWGLVDVY